MKQKPSIQFYVQDFLGSIDVQMMSAEEVGVYCLLLFNCFNNGGTLPSDPKGLAKICRGVQPTELVLKKFYADGEFLRNFRIDFEIKKQKKFSKKMSEAANNRWNQRNAKALSRQSSSSSTSTSSSNINTPLPPKGDLCSEFIKKFNEETGRAFKPTKNYATSLAARLKEGFTLEDIFSAVRAAAGDKFLRGENDRGKEYLTPEFILRPNKLQEWLNKPELSPKTERDYFVVEKGVRKQVSEEEYKRKFPEHWKKINNLAA